MLIATMMSATAYIEDLGSKRYSPTASYSSITIKSYTELNDLETKEGETYYSYANSTQGGTNYFFIDTNKDGVPEHWLVSDTSILVYNTTFSSLLASEVISNLNAVFARDIDNDGYTELITFYDNDFYVKNLTTNTIKNEYELDNIYNSTIDHISFENDHYIFFTQSTGTLLKKIYYDTNYHNVSVSLPLASVSNPIDSGFDVNDDGIEEVVVLQAISSTWDSILVYDYEFNLIKRTNVSTNLGNANDIHIINDDGENAEFLLIKEGGSCGDATNTKCGAVLISYEGVILHSNYVGAWSGGSYGAAKVKLLQRSPAYYSILYTHPSVSAGSGSYIWYKASTGTGTTIDSYTGYQYGGRFSHTWYLYIGSVVGTIPLIFLRYTSTSYLYGVDNYKYFNITDLPQLNYAGISIADIDGDNREDIILYTSSMVRVYVYNETYGYEGTINDFSVVGSASPNPALLGATTTFSATPIDPYGEESNITVNINDEFGSLYTWDWRNVPSGYTATNEISGSDWQNFAVNDYTVTIDGRANYGVGYDTYNLSFIWEVIEEGFENVTAYNISERKLTGLSDVRGADTQGNGKSWFIGKQGGIMKIWSATANLLTNNLVNLSDDLTITSSTTGMNVLKSLQIQGNHSYIGTNNELYIYAGAEFGTASSLVKEDDISVAGISNDDITDITSYEEGSVWVCNSGITSDGILWYNGTSNDFDFTLDSGNNPCYSLYADNTLDAVMVHKGTSIKVYNASDALINGGSVSESSTITTAGGIMYGNDLISSNNKYLFIISSRLGIRKYDLTNLSSPVLIAECRSDRNVVSLEALTDNLVIVGTTLTDWSSPTIEVCDFANSETYTYLLSSGFYTATNLKNLAEGEIPYEITKNSANRFSVALDTGFGIYDFGSYESIEIINQKPTIDDVELSTTNPCINETVNIYITASDQNGDTIYYDVSCDANTRRTMANYYSTPEPPPCEYLTTGTKSLIIFVADDTYRSSPTTQNAYVNVQGCTASPKILMEVRDSVTGISISGVSITIDNTDTTTTDSRGYATFNVDDTTTYHTLSFNKEGYNPKDYPNVQAGGNRKVFTLDPTTYSGTVLTIITQNGTGSPIGNTLVSVSNQITGESQFKLTDSNGRAIFYDSITGAQLIVTAKNEPQGYDATGIWYVSLQEGEQKTLYINLSSKWIIGQGDWIVTDRGCKDLVTGVWLCGNLSTTGSGSKCEVDADCISGRCGLGNTCSMFNYSICDAKGAGRGNTCVFTATAEGIIAQLAKILFYGFVTVLIIIIIVVFILLLRKK